jgi:hypothetical protein
MEVGTNSSIRLARYPQDTQQNNAVNLVSVLAYFHTTPSGVVFFRAYERVVVFASDFWLHEGSDKKTVARKGSHLLD